MKIALHHIGLTTPDLARLLDFYKRAFRAEIVREGGWDAKDTGLNRAVGMEGKAVKLILLKIGGAHIEIFEFSETPKENSAETIHSTGLTHIAFAVENIEVEYERLRAMGVPFFTDPFRGPAGGKFVYGRDPDGNIIELVQPPD